MITLPKSPPSSRALLGCRQSAVVAIEAVDHLVTPETVVRWHRAGFRMYWRLISESDFEQFLKTMRLLGPKLGPIVFKFRFSIELRFETGMNSRIDSFPSECFNFRIARHRLKRHAFETARESLVCCLQSPSTAPLSIYAERVTYIQRCPCNGDSSCRRGGLAP